jgi:hypothetical protein
MQLLGSLPVHKMAFSKVTASGAQLHSDNPIVLAGHPGITQKACGAKGCCWLPFIDVEDNFGGPRLDMPACFHPNMHASVYAVEDAKALAADNEVLCMGMQHQSPPSLCHARLTTVPPCCCRRRWC